VRLKSRRPAPLVPDAEGKFPGRGVPGSTAAASPACPAGGDRTSNQVSPPRAPCSETSCSAWA